MTNKTKLTVTYDDDSTETLEISSSSGLVDDVDTLKASSMDQYTSLLNLSKNIDSFLRLNDIKKLEYEEEEED